MRTLKWLATAASALLAGCLATTPTVDFREPQSARPLGANPVLVTAMIPPSDGTIFQAASYRGLFEDRRARLIGDTITINLVERNTAQKSANANATRNGNMSAGIGPINRLPLSGLNGLELEADAESDFNGNGAAAANNVFNGTITVTVIDVYPNGNLLVSGEKMVAINQGNEFIRFSGVINPNTVTTANSVQSTQVADARIEYRGSGFIDESNTMGWLQRFFVAIMPF